MRRKLSAMVTAEARLSANRLNLQNTAARTTARSVRPLQSRAQRLKRPSAIQILPLQNVAVDVEPNQLKKRHRASETWASGACPHVPSFSSPFCRRGVEMLVRVCLCDHRTVLWTRRLGMGRLCRHPQPLQWRRLLACRAEHRLRPPA